MATFPLKIMTPDGVAFDGAVTSVSCRTINGQLQLLARHIDICTALGCTRPQLQQAFRARLHRTAMEEFSAMRIEYAAQLLARGASPGEVAAQMCYCSGAYFSQKFRAATGHTPSAYRRIQQGLPARRQNRQQKGKSESKTPIAETPQKE